MSSFICEKCGDNIVDTPTGYITECKHYPFDSTNLNAIIETKFYYNWYPTNNKTICAEHKDELNKYAIDKISNETRNRMKDFVGSNKTFYGNIENGLLLNGSIYTYQCYWTLTLKKIK